MVGDRVVEGALGAVELLEADDGAGAGGLGEVEQLAQRGDLDQVHVGQGRVEVGDGYVGEGVEGVGARLFVVGDEALLDEEEQELFDRVGFGLKAFSASWAALEAGWARRVSMRPSSKLESRLMNREGPTMYSRSRASVA